ncbi:MAG: sensor domain-containing diguanylate cyclase [Nitrospiraceae bacterium]|nr:sensor domain-containing diguanylate cyclase [Nitrospiraceae bacterium]
MLIYLTLYLARKNTISSFSFEYLFGFALIIAGAIKLSGYAWLHTVYLLYLIPLTAFFPMKTMILLSLSVPLLEASHFINSNNIYEEVSVSIVTIIAAITSSWLFASANKKILSVESQLIYLKKETSDISAAGAVSVQDDNAVAQYLSMISRADKDIKEVLQTIKHSLTADSVNFFVPYNNTLKLRSTTEETENIIPSGNGFIMACYKEKRTIISADVNEKGYEVGYLKKGRISSFISIPVIDEPFVLGVLSADTSRYSAFTEIDTTTLNLLSKQLIRILQQERVHSQIHRSHSGLKILHEESVKLTESLKFEDLSQKIVESCLKIAPSKIILFTKKGEAFELLHKTDDIKLTKNLYSPRGTLLDMAKKNRKIVCLSDVRNYTYNLMPFETRDIASVLILPLLYEGELTGMIVFLSEKLSAFNSHQIELLVVLGTQASISIANAKFHAEIKRLSVVDGLTGLFNHRHFQEKLTDEFRRLDRTQKPFSILLLDIDYFKKVNDTYGHPAGDKILQGVANIMKNTMRDIDIAARYGGEEFVAILPDTDSTGAMNIAERLRQQTLDNGFNIDGKNIHVTVSIGISTAAGKSDDKKSLVEKADQALYHAKNNGRNQCVLWSEIRR